MKHCKTIFVLMILGVAGTLISCGSTKFEGATMNVLDTSVSRDDFKIVPEDNFDETMKNVVEPKLESIMERGTFASNIGGHRIYYEIFDVEKERGSVVMLHGFTEFTKKYNELIYYFTEAGFDVYIMDHFGHGYSERSEAVDGNLSKVAVDDFDVYVDDAFQFITDVVNKKRDRNKPFVLWGHSMGGGVATRLLEKYPAQFDAAILSSPMLDIDTGGTPEWIARFVAVSAKAFGAGGNYIFGHDDFTPEEYFDDPSCSASSYPRYKYAFDLRTENEYYQTNGATWYWLDSAIKATKVARDYDEAKKVTLPVLMFQAEKDALVESQGQLEFASRAKNVNVIFCPETHHEVFNSPDDIANAYWVTIFDFLDMVL